MKKILPGICLLFITKMLTAQVPAITLDTIDRKPQIRSSIKNNLLAQGIFSHPTSKGKVYILPYDNMPCLVPDMQQITPMPRSNQRFPESRMPNAIPRRELIPGQEKRPE